MKPFLLLTTRSEDAAAAEEYEEYQRLTGLAQNELHWIRVEQTPLSDFALENYSGLFVAGSPYNASDPVEAKTATQLRVEADLARLLDRVVERDFPFFGACYGVGTLGAHQGAIIDRTYGENTASVPITLTEAGASDPLLAGIPPVFEAFVGHKEACRELPDHAVLLASSPACPVQAFRIKQNLYATQFHPDLTTKGIVTRIHAYRDNGYFAPEAMDEVINRVSTADVSHSHRLLANFAARYAA